MARTFSVLAATLTLAILVTIGLGFWSFFTPKDVDGYKDIFIVHFFLGLFTAIGILFVHCLVFIYFLGTGRWVKEVTLAYEMPDEPHHKHTRELKRKTFPPALFAMLIGIAAAASGAGVQLQEWKWQVHFLAAMATLLINLWAFRIEIRNVTINAGVIRAVEEEADRIRVARGLKPSAEALAEEEQIADLRRPG